MAIDIGTTSSTMSVWKDNRILIIPNEYGRQETPMYVSFTDTEQLVGDAAKDQVDINPLNTIYDVTRLIGRAYADPHLQTDMKHWPFKVVDKVGKPIIQVTFKGQTQPFTPEEIFSILIQHL